MDNPKLEQARQKLAAAAALDKQETEAEKAQEAMENVLEAKKLLAQVRKEHMKEIRRMDLDSIAAFFDQHVRQYARPSEASAFDNLVKTAQRAIERNDREFEHHMDELRGKNFDILWRQDWFVLERFKRIAGTPHLFADKACFEELVQAGAQFMRNDDMEKLRGIVARLSMMQIGGSPDNDIFDTANIIRG